jgi:deazaflavin-dependent oxidoreductase (nitroreductase family)
MRNGILKTALGLPNALYDAGLGRIFGHRFLRLMHTGRKSGRRYNVMLEVVRYDRATGEAVVMVGLGARSDWLRNLRAGGPAWVDFGFGPRRALLRELDPAEAAAVLADYERRAGILRPLVARVLSRLAGFAYRGTDDDRLRLVTTLPLVAFRPAPQRGTRHPAADPT